MKLLKSDSAEKVPKADVTVRKRVLSNSFVR